MEVITRLQAALTGRCSIAHEIGRGGMATVYLASDLKHERGSALKNVGRDTMKSLFVFSAPGFDRYLRATSSLAGQPVVPFKPGEFAAVDKKYRAEILFRDPTK